jgi:hypothetical protein
MTTCFGLLGHLQVITINNIKAKTYTQLISGGLVCGAGFWCRISAWYGEYLLMLRDSYVSVNGCFSFSCPSEWCCSCGGFMLDSAVCVRVAGVAMRADWAGLLPEGRERKIYSCESVCVLVGRI